MRVLKFRAWDIEKKEFTVVGFHIIGEVTVFDLIKGYSIESLNNLVVTQFTGVKDINGIDIYEGDLVKSVQNHEKSLLNKIFGDGIPNYTTGEVKWLCEGWKICQKNLGASLLSDFVCCGEHPAALEVISNIFQNVKTN